MGESGSPICAGSHKPLNKQGSIRAHKVSNGLTEKSILIKTKIEMANQRFAFVKQFVQLMSYQVVFSADF